MPTCLASTEVVGFEIIKRAAGAPGPSAERAPIFQRTWLAFVDESDDAFGEAGAVVGLDAGGNDCGVAPIFGKDLLLPGGASAIEGGPLFRSEAFFEGGENFGAEGEFEDDGDGSGGVGGSGKRELNVDGEERVGGIVDMAEEDCFGDDGDVFVEFARGADDFPADMRNVGGNAAEDVAVEVFDNLRAALRPPDLRGGDLVAIFEEERIGEGVGADFGFVDVGGVGRFGIAVGAATKGGDVEEVESALVVLLGGEMDDGREVGLWGEEDGEEG